MTEQNGHRVLNGNEPVRPETAAPSSLAVVERVRDFGAPFEQKTHTLMLESVDKVTQQWVGELNHVRENTKVIEELVIQQAARVKSDLTKLHLLGMQAMKEAQRGKEFAGQLATELDQMLSEHREVH